MTLSRLLYSALPVITSLLCATAIAQTPPAPGHLPFSISVYDRTRAEGWQWFAAPPQNETYGYLESLVRISIAQKIRHYDWQLELTQPALFDLPSHAVNAVSARGQLGLGGTYYASNGNNAYPAAAALKQGFLRYRFGEDKTLRVGRFEFFDGQELQPKNSTLAWLQTNRVAQRLIGNFGFSNAQRSFDGIDAHYNVKNFDLTAMAARSDQGVYNMNANPELNVDLQYLALSRYQARQQLLWRVFAIGYHDGRTGVVKADNRALAVRQADHHNIRIGTYGADLLTTVPVGTAGQFDFVAWGALQNGDWGVQHHSASAGTLEGGFKFTGVPTSPWLRAGYFRSSGDNNPTDDQHKTFFQILPTPRVYARFPFFNLMDSTDQFVQVIDKPAKRLELRADLHGLQLSSNKDLWYLGGGAFDNKVFGFTGRPANSHASFASFADMSADWQVDHNLALNFYYAHTWGKRVVGAIYPTDTTAQFGYVEAVYRWGLPQRASTK